MAFDAAFWSTDYADILLVPDFSGSSESYASDGGWTRGTLDEVDGVTFLFCFGSDLDGTKVTSKSMEYGHLYAKRDDTSAVIAFDYGWHGGRKLATYGLKDGMVGRSPLVMNGTVLTDEIYVANNGGSIDSSIYLYQPHTWYGLQSEVIAAILLHKGFDDDYIDKTAFSAAHDGQTAWGDAEDRPWCLYKRELDQPLAESIKALARHSWDLLAVNLAGKIGLYSRTTPAAAQTISGLGDDDGVVGRVTWRVAYEHLSNSMIASCGRWISTQFATLSGSITAPTSATMLTDCSAFEGTRDFRPFVTAEDATSVTKYGKIVPGDSRMTVRDGGQEIEFTVYHLPYLVYDDAEFELPLATYVTRLSAAESTPRREITLTQDFRGLDYDVGYFIEDVDLTGDGQTFDAFCISKTVDFRRMQVTSVLLEEPA